MDVGEATVHSFIVKLWLEDDDGEGKRTAWHGYITHVPTGARRYLQNLSDVTEFIRQHLDENDARNSFKSRKGNWLKRLILKPTKHGS
jgi:hypothetical protein